MCCESHGLSYTSFPKRALLQVWRFFQFAKVGWFNFCNYSQSSFPHAFPAAPRPLPVPLPLSGLPLRVLPSSSGILPDVFLVLIISRKKFIAEFLPYSMMAFKKFFIFTGFWKKKSLCHEILGKPLLVQEFGQKHDFRSWLEEKLL